jgi:4-hydroxyphenylpyruvate dioxygenase
MSANPTGMLGISFVEFASPNPAALDDLFVRFGFSRVRELPGEDVMLYAQNEIQLLVNRGGGFAKTFAAEHGPGIPGMGWRFVDAKEAFRVAVARGARAYPAATPYGVPAIYGIGDSLIYFVDDRTCDVLRQFVPTSEPILAPEMGFLTIDHLTNNVHKGTLPQWQSFYRDVFGFTEVRTFDIHGEKTGLFSYALRSPDGSFCIPINEGTEEKSQIEEYLREYRGPGVQHLAFLSRDLLASLDALSGSGVQTLDIDEEYYATIHDRVPGVTEDHDRIQAHKVLVDGDDDGYLLQIFTKNLVGPIFIEMIQRKNHLSFGEGNFGALFRSIERDQERRGVL